MKRAIGIHLGHDAGIAVVSENGIDRYLSKERRSRCKLAAGWDYATFAAELQACSGSPIGLSNTQGSHGIITEPLHDLHVHGPSRRIKFEQIALPDKIKAKKLAWAQSLSNKSVASYQLRERWPSNVLT